MFQYLLYAHKIMGLRLGLETEEGRVSFQGNQLCNFHFSLPSQSASTPKRKPYEHILLKKKVDLPAGSGQIFCLFKLLQKTKHDIRYMFLYKTAR